MAALEEAAPTAATAAPRLNRAFVAALMLSYFGSNVALVAPIQNVLPRMVEAAAGSAGKALGLGVVTGIGALAALVVNPVAGHISDRWVGTDNRSVTVLIGLVTGGLSLGLLGLSHSLVAIAVWWTLCQATINIAYSPMSAIVVDHVDRRSWGFVWGLISVAQAVGLIVGFAMVVLAFPGTRGGMTAVTVMYVVCLAPLVLVLYWLPRVSYAGSAGEAGRSRTRFSDGISALLSAGQGFGKVWAGKFLVMLAETIALLYLFYYLQDVVHYSNPSQGQLILVLIATAGGHRRHGDRRADRRPLARRLPPVRGARVGTDGADRVRARLRHRMGPGGRLRVRPRRRLRRVPVRQPGAVHRGAPRPGKRRP